MSGLVDQYGDRRSQKRRDNRPGTIGLDDSKTEIVLLASEKIGKDAIYKKDLYPLVYEMTVHETSGTTIRVITSSQAGPVECPMGEVTVYVVSRTLKEDAVMSGRASEVVKKSVAQALYLDCADV